MFHNHIFNLNDQPLLLVIFQCGLLSILLPFSKSDGRRSNFILSVFLLAIGVTAFDTLIYWNLALKAIFADYGIGFFMLFKFSVYLTGPSLYFYTKSKLYNDFEFSRQDWLHAIPLIIFPFLMLLTYQGFNQQELALAVFDYQVLFHNSFFQIHLMAIFVLQTIYAVFSLYLMHEYKQKLEQKFSTLVDIDHSWLKMMIIGFIVISCWKVSAHISHWISDQYSAGMTTASAIGVASNFLMFIFINALVVYSLVHSNVFKGIKSKTEHKETLEHEVIPKSHIDIVTRLIVIEKVYLHPSITLEQLADQAKLSVRQLSAVINRHFEKNFFDFINYYRVENAKILLADSVYKGSILDVFEQSGFNSKSAFNRFFKKYTHTTPSEFRRLHKADSALEP